MIVKGLGAAIALIIGLGWLGLEWRYRRRPGNALVTPPGQWDIKVLQDQTCRLVGQQTLINLAQGVEVMIPELSVTATLLAKEDLSDTQVTTRVIPKHPDMEARPDGYWFAYIVKGRKATHVEIQVDIKGSGVPGLKAAWLQIHYVTYGPKGRIPRTHHEVIPLRFPDPQVPLQWRSTPQAQVLPVPTHLLTQLDNCVEVVKRYVLPHAQPGDIVTLGETPVAIIQGRWRHPSEIQPGWVARRVCQFFLPTSSLATACGMQALVDVVGPLRVLGAFIGGSIAKIFGYPGGFYQLAGEQARLIDDVTGTLPPYDQFIVLGPENPQQVVDQIQAETGLAAAIVDVNDLKAVKVLAATRGVSLPLLEAALQSNPAGNADEQTPVVLIRPQGSASP
ncbi:F420-0:Gamma-glutamyl ligase [Synechococcales cyanobacterium C]|uniref:F420-0:Gamma-glutamyl ligase n=2 Tax=Petrachloros TaxID=2918834 RepID=A0A8K2A229_9CYAN|nr:F420-0:Gamma-glutamyl ligase [Petrachloros mirabilis]NCJ08412.1 F420-0:Gamma-glutamyl ligase [Petrachloros mirabilis ULC683]